ncbi:MAG: glutamate synthase subunit alpha, partial [Clostridiales bacterium]|nr:glutamate synthase subunit alpha [Clostridiales bacterium]
QNPELRKKFTGKPEYVINFMTFIAQEMREIMAQLGIRTIEELVGRSDLLKSKVFPERTHPAGIDMSTVLYNPYANDKSVKQHFVSEDRFDFRLGDTIDEEVILPAFKDAIEAGTPASIDIEVTNLNRTLGTLTGAEITRKYYNTLDDDTYTVNCKGSGGQSFGAFIPKGLTISLEGDANDYYGKGLSGGILSIQAPGHFKLLADENIIIGNVALFGATSGKAFINGVAGERFCVRNSGATVVVEGVGDHGCEYMTGGMAVILGKVGKNFAAGMSGGIAYVLDEENDLYTKLNKSLVGFSRIKEEEDRQQLKSLIEEHVRRTGSHLGEIILKDFDKYVTRFKKVVPHDYQAMMDTIAKYEKSGMNEEDARVAAFHERTNG